MTLSRREAEMGFGDEIPKRGMGWQPHGNPQTPQGNPVPLTLTTLSLRDSWGKMEYDFKPLRSGDGVWG